jgi:hypothetical protein
MAAASLLNVSDTLRCHRECLLAHRCAHRDASRAPSHRPLPALILGSTESLPTPVGQAIRGLWAASNLDDGGGDLRMSEGVLGKPQDSRAFEAHAACPSCVNGVLTMTLSGKDRIDMVGRGKQPLCCSSRPGSTCGGYRAGPH